MDEPEFLVSMYHARNDAVLFDRDAALPESVRRGEDLFCSTGRAPEKKTMTISIASDQ